MNRVEDLKAELSKWPDSATRRLCLDIIDVLVRLSDEDLRMLTFTSFKNVTNRKYIDDVLIGAVEIPVPLDTEPRQQIMRDIITECHESSKSWVAANSKGAIVGCALARPDFHERGAISLRYIAVNKNSRRQGVFGTLIEKLKANAVPLTASVLHTNKSDMGKRLKNVGFVEVKTDDGETKYRWAPPKPDAA